MEKSKHTVKIEPGDREVSVGQDQTLLKILQEEGYPIQSTCGGEGLCGTCWVQIKRGCPEPTEADKRFFSEKELKDGIRLSCRIQVLRDMVVQIPNVVQPLSSKELMNKSIEGLKVDPGVKKIYLKLPTPGRGDQRADTERVAYKLDRKVYFPHRILQKLPGSLAKSDFKITVTIDQDGQILNVEPGNRTQNIYGMAFDIGTTTVAVYTLDLINGRELAVRSFENPQSKFGADVISRIKHVHEQSEKGLADLRAVLIDKLNWAVLEICNKNGIELADIVKSTFVGNPTMLHLLAGIDPTNIDHSPYIPVFKSLTHLSAKDLELKINPLGKSYLLPQVSGYVGADITAGIFYTKLHESDSLKLLIDVGTNGEIVLGNRDRVMAASTAAGPAFEGAGIKQGMSAHPGAINRVRIEDNKVEIEVIGNASPKGICGCGLVDVVGQLLKAGLLTKEGKFKTDSDSPLTRDRLKNIDGKFSFNLTTRKKPVWLTQKDIRKLQLAKGAIRAGVEILLEEIGLSAKEIEEVYLAGAFGNYLEAENVLRLGLLPPQIGEEKVVSAGNTAGQGAKLCLLNMDNMKELEELSEKVEYEELSYREDFSDKFMKAMRFPDQKMGN